MSNGRLIKLRSNKDVVGPLLLVTRLLLSGPNL
jgi:hypothetical protein